jgi:hypothetical protein
MQLRKLMFNRRLQYITYIFCIFVKYYWPAIHLLNAGDLQIPFQHGYFPF